MDTQQQSPQNSIEPQSGQENPNTGKKEQPFKKYLLPVGVILLLALGYLWFQNSNLPSSSSDKITVQSSGITREQKLAALSEDERKTLEKKLESELAEVKAFNDQTSVEDKNKTYIKLASAQRALGFYSEAIESLGKITSEYKNQGRVFINYALVYKDLGDDAKTNEYAKKAIDLDPENPQYWVIYLESDTNLSNADREARYKEVIEKTDSHEDVLVSYAKFLEQIGNIPAAIEQYKKAGEVNQSEKPQFDAEITRLEATK